MNSRSGRLGYSEGQAHCALPPVGPGGGGSTGAKSEAESVISAFQDSDWAGCRRNHKSTSGGVLTIGAMDVKT